MQNNPQYDLIVEKQKKRYALLRKIYELTEGVESRIVELECPETLDLGEVLSIIDYLSAEGLVVQLSGNAPLVQISHRGVVEVEESVTNPNRPTEHFLAQV